MFIPDSAAILKRLEAAGWPVLATGGNLIGGNETAWLLRLPRLMPVELHDVLRQLEPIEERQARHQQLMNELDQQSAERQDRDRAFRRAALRDLLGD